jgi:hypothetical protein
VDSLFTSTLFWIFTGTAFVAAELGMTMLLVRLCTRPMRNPGN